jgi:sigma-B regulation protein RsbU (phosphoserine phosphatase)
MTVPGQATPHGGAVARTATLIVANPSGNRTRVALEPVPFGIGRHPDNNLVLRDNRASRNHARIIGEGGEYFVEDLNSSHGVFVNGVKVERQKLYNLDRIEFGFPDSYSVVFTLEEAEIQRLLEQFSAPKGTTSAGAGNLAKLRALVEVARALQNSLSTEDVLTAVVDAALAITGFERGFLLLTKEDDLEITVARDRRGASLSKSDLQVPVNTIQRALRQRRELLSMTFDPQTEGFSPDSSAYHLELRSVVCVPLVHVRTGSTEETCMITSKSDTVGLIYLDSKQTAVDLSSGNRELLQTLALEASTILENARLLEEERQKRRMEEELNIAREIQVSLLPRSLPSKGWFRAAGSSIPSHQVGGDCFDVRQLGPKLWSTVVTDVSGKGVSSALLAALLQGAFLSSSEESMDIERLMQRINNFLNERTEGEKYATVFYCTIREDGTLRWANAGHCTPFLLRSDGEMQTLRTTGMPLGMLSIAQYEVEQVKLQAGDKIVAYSDGLSEAQNADCKFFEAARLRDVLRENAGLGCVDLLDKLMSEIDNFTEGAAQSDDMTAVVIEYHPADV